MKMMFKFTNLHLMRYVRIVFAIGFCSLTYENNLYSMQLLLESNHKKLAEDAAAGASLLHTAAANDQEEAVTFMLAHGFDVNLRTKEGNTPLHYAVDAGRLNIVEILLATPGVDINTKNEKGETPLYRAARYSRINILTCLLEKGASVYALTTNGETPLHHAAAHIQKEAVKILLAYYSEINARDEEGRSPLFYVAKESGKGAADLAGTLIQCKADVNARDMYGSTPLHRATDSPDKRLLVQIFLDAGADFAVADKAGVTALHKAARGSDGGVVDLLLEKGADFMVIDKDEKTPLHWAVGAWRDALTNNANSLIAHGADVGAKDKEGKTAIDYATNTVEKDELRQRLCCVCSSCPIPKMSKTVSISSECVHRIHMDCRESLLASGALAINCPQCQVVKDN